MKYPTSIPFFAGLALMLACSPVQPVQEVVNEPTVSTAEGEQLMIDRLKEEQTLFRAGYADSVNAGFIAEDKFKGSARREARSLIDGANIVVNYGSPGTRGRTIWNGLVEYGNVWVSGSHWATAVSFERDVLINGERVAAGTYAFFTIPEAEKWTLILNENYDQHLAEDYDEALDVVRMEVSPETLDGEVKRLTYTVEETTRRNGVIRLRWENLSVAMPFAVFPDRGLE